MYIHIMFFLRYYKDKRIPFRNVCRNCVAIFWRHNCLELDLELSKFLSLINISERNNNAISRIFFFFFLYSVKIVSTMLLIVNTFNF